MLKVKLHNETFSFPTRMIVDSGADDTLLNADIAPSLGINLLTCLDQKVGGITGSSTGYIHKVNIEIPELGGVIEVDAIFVPKLGTSGLLGQRELFSKYDVQFQKSKLKFYLRKVPILKF